ncbi:MAG: DUF1918 domain-containing protein [Streptosporangiaceae bacterium]
MVKANIGDRLIADGHSDRVGVIIGLRNADGTPPYIVKWQTDGHIALFFPGPYTRIAPAEPAADGPLAEGSTAGPARPAGKDSAAC